MFNFTTETEFSQEELQRSLLDFYLLDQPNYEGVNPSGVLDYTLDQLEMCHSWVQWVFPLDEPSAVNPNAPLLTRELIEKLSDSISFKEIFALLADKFYKFLCMEDRNTISNELVPIWITPHNHNFLRITRVIKSALLLKQHNVAEKFYSYAREMYEKYPEIIGDETLKFWVAAYYPHMKKYIEFKSQADNKKLIDVRSEEIRNEIDVYYHSITPSVFLGSAVETHCAITILTNKIAELQIKLEEYEKRKM